MVSKKLEFAIRKQGVTNSTKEVPETLGELRSNAACRLMYIQLKHRALGCQRLSAKAHFMSNPSCM